MPTPQTYVIAIDEGEFVEAASIPGKIAEAIFAIPDADPVLGHLSKKTLVTEKHWRIDDLAAEDWAMLKRIWAALPDVAGITMPAFEPHRRAFDALAGTDKPAWELLADFHDPREAARLARDYCRSEHFTLIDRAIRDGKLPALTRIRVPAETLSSGVIVAVENLRRYLQALGIAVEITVPPSKSGKAHASKAKGPPTPSPIEPVGRHRAQELWIAQSLKARNIDPRKLPRNRPGYPGIKADIWLAAEKEPRIFNSRDVFDAAWKRMRAGGELKDA